MRLKKFAFILMILCDILICMSVYSNTVTENLSDKLLRLHIIAEDNQKVNQDIKIAVRDIIIKQINDKKYGDKYEVVSSLGEVSVFSDDNQTEINQDKMTHIFSHPDYNCRFRNCNICSPDHAIRLADFTAGRELHSPQRSSLLYIILQLI